jgi:hypothetical protein
VTAHKVRHLLPIPERDNHVNRSRLAALSAGAMFLVAAVLVPATALAAGNGTLSVSPAAVTTSTGSTFSVDINSSASTPMSGVSAAIDFDKSRLQIISVTKGTDWDVSGIAWVFPTVGDIATANATGHLTTLAAYFQDGSSSRPANTTLKVASVTFFATATGSASISLPIAGNKGGIIDGAAATYGSEVTTVGNGATVTVNSSGGSANQVTANVTGSVQAPRLALTCDSPVNVPLVRNATNQAPFSCQVASDGNWTLSVKDTNATVGQHGHLIDPSQTPTAVLANSLHVHDSAGDVDLAAAPDSVPVSAGSATVSVPLTFTQVVNPGDKPGSYGMSVLFSIVNTF